MKNYANDICYSYFSKKNAIFFLISTYPDYIIKKETKSVNLEILIFSLTIEAYLRIGQYVDFCTFKPNLTVNSNFYVYFIATHTMRGVKTIKRRNFELF